MSETYTQEDIEAARNEGIALGRRMIIEEIGESLSKKQLTFETKMAAGEIFKGNE